MNNKLDFIESMRGLAVLLVFVVHVSIVIPTSSSSINSFLGLGAKGVILFYIISSFTLFLSLDRKKDTYSNFFLKRIFRIAPLFYVALLVYIFVNYVNGTTFSLSNIISHFLFLNGFSPYWINSIMGVEWSIAVEMVFYLMVPFLFANIKNTSQALLFTSYVLVLSLLLKGTISLFSETSTWQGYFYKWLPNQLPVFGLGFIFYFMWKDKISPNYKKLKFLKDNPFNALVILFGVLSIGFDVVVNKELNFVFALVFFVALYYVSKVSPKLFVNRFLGFIGKISYSMYLWHFLIIKLINSKLEFEVNGVVTFALFFAIALSVSIGSSYLTYRFIELKTITIARKIIKMKESKVVGADNNNTVSASNTRM